ncbi:MAG: hypothetical protein ACPLY7_02515, partial [Microgenomates group bacterium]
MFYTNEEKQPGLVLFFRWILVVSFLILLARAFELQIIKGDYFRSLSEKNRIRRVTIQAPRGKIMARGGQVLADNIESKKRIIFDPLYGYIKSDQIENSPEEEKISQWKRVYPLGEKAAHITGYLGEVSQDEVSKVNPDCIDRGPWKLGDLVGRGGLEEKYDCLLSGIDGEKLIEVDTTGKKVRILGEKKPIAGKDLKTTIDYDLQLKVAEIMSGKKGAIVVSDKKGEILALYSSPSFDPNYFINKDSDKVNKILKDENMPMFNRAL